MDEELLKKTSGFTLIELLIVISILVILSTIGFVTYSSAQKAARDNNRRLEIIALSKSFEARKNLDTFTYKYTIEDITKDFPSGIPYKDIKGKDYCVAGLNSLPPPANMVAIDMNKSCRENDNNYIALYDSISASGDVNPLFPIGSDSGIKAWTICTRMENSPTPYCASSVNR